MSDLRRAIALMDSKQFVAALPLFHAALRRSEQKPDGASSAETAGILDMLSFCHSSLSDFRAAAEHFRRAAAIIDYYFEGRILASNNAATALNFLSDYVEIDKQIITSP